MKIFKVSGMNCSHCTQAIQKAILGIDQQAIVHTDIGAQTVEIDSSCDSAVLQKAIEEAGYTVSAQLS